MILKVELTKKWTFQRPFKFNGFHFICSSFPGEIINKWLFFFQYQNENQLLSQRGAVLDWKLIEKWALVACNSFFILVLKIWGCSEINHTVWKDMDTFNFLRFGRIMIDLQVNQSAHSANPLFLLKDNLREKLVRFVDLDVSVLLPLVELEEVGVFRWGESVARHCCYERFRQNLGAEIQWDEKRNQDWKWDENYWSDKEIWYPEGKSVLLLPWSDGMVVLF